jgi:hypothetical protein
MLFVPGAKAQGGFTARKAAGLALGLTIPQDSAAIWQGALLQQAGPAQTPGEGSSDIAITGLLKAIYLAGGALNDVVFEQWHGDGTEILNILNGLRLESGVETKGEYHENCKA